MKILIKWREIIVEKMMLTIWYVFTEFLFTNLSRFSKEWGKSFIEERREREIRGKIENENMHKMERNHHRKDSAEDFKCL